MKLKKDLHKHLCSLIPKEAYDFWGITPLSEGYHARTDRNTGRLKGVYMPYIPSKVFPSKTYTEKTGEKRNPISSFLPNYSALPTHETLVTSSKIFNLFVRFCFNEKSEWEVESIFSNRDLYNTDSFSSLLDSHYQENLNIENIKGYNARDCTENQEIPFVNPVVDYSKIQHTNYIVYNSEYRYDIHDNSFLDSYHMPITFSKSVHNFLTEKYNTNIQEPLHSAIRCKLSLRVQNGVVTPFRFINSSIPKVILDLIDETYQAEINNHDLIDETYFKPNVKIATTNEERNFYTTNLQSNTLLPLARTTYYLNNLGVFD